MSGQFESACNLYRNIFLRSGDNLRDCKLRCVCIQPLKGVVAYFQDATREILCGRHREIPRQLECGAFNLGTLQCVEHLFHIGSAGV